MKFKNCITLFPLYIFLIPFVFIINELRTVFFYYYKTTFTDKLVFSAIIFGSALILFIISKLFTKHNNKAGLLSLIPLLFFCFYFDIYNYLAGFILFNNLQIIQGMASHYVFIIIVLVITLAIVILLRKSKKPFVKLTLYLNIIFAIFLFIEIYRYAEIDPFKPELINKEVSVEKINKKIMPDIYYLVFDGYTSNTSLKRFWNYNNSGIKNFLLEKGFWVSDSSTSNYNATELSKISALNLSYLNINSPEEFYRINYIDFENLLDDNSLFRFLRKYNYEIKSDYTFDYPYMPWVGKGSIENLYYRTIIYLFQEKLSGTKTPDFYKTYETQINNIININRKEKPLFNTMHITLPHCPNIYDSSGNRLFTDNKKINFDDDKDKYLEQVKYSNSLIKKIVSSILEKENYEPIIIIQGDHGFRNLKNLSKNDMLEESFSIMNAIYLPGNNYSQFYSKISSVNTFRMVLNTCFGADYKKLEDKKVNIFVN